MKNLPALLSTASISSIASIAATAAIATFTAPALAVEVEGNVTLASDYSFRGWSQTQRDPAIQGGFDVGFESGLYVGTWASNVNFGETSMEWDLIVGWGGEISEGIELDVSFIYFDYPNDRDALNYQELAGSLSFSDFTVGVNYSPEYLAAEDVKFLYPYVDYSYGLSEDVSLDLHVGYNMSDSPDGGFFVGQDEYVDYSVGLSFPLGGATLSIGVYGTDLDECGRDCEARPILSISR